MSRLAPLLRALLCLILLVNGTTYAHAATRMALGKVGAAGQAAPPEEAPCHESMAVMDAGPADALDHTAGKQDAAGLPDCCTAGPCDGFCSLHASAMVWPMMLHALQPARAIAPAYRADAHASVRLSHRHRPPILAA